jgi:hypothetical protein
MLRLGSNTTLHHKEIAFKVGHGPMETSLTMSRVFSEIEFFGPDGIAVD